MVKSTRIISLVFSLNYQNCNVSTLPWAKSHGYCLWLWVQVRVQTFFINTSTKVFIRSNFANLWVWTRVQIQSREYQYAFHQVYDGAWARFQSLPCLTVMCTSIFDVIVFDWTQMRNITEIVQSRHHVKVWDSYLFDQITRSILSLSELNQERERLLKGGRT